MHEALNSPFVVPVAVFIMVLGISLGGMITGAYQTRLRAEQRMAMVAQGKSVEEIERLLGNREDEGKVVRDPLRSLANARRTGIVLVSCGLGISFFFILLWMILNVREVLSGAAAGLIPVAIGVGFFIDYYLQKRELSRFGLEVDADRV